jgi:Zn-dependent protease with chaperone function
VRILFPLLLLISILVLLTTAMVSAVLAVLAPIVLVLTGLVSIVGLRSFSLGLQLIRGGFGLLSTAINFLRDALRLVFVWPNVENELSDTQFPTLVARLSSPQFPDFHRLQTSVANELNLRPAEELWISPDTALGITTALRNGKRIRCLVIGLGLIRLLTPEQLRAVLLHEFGHEKGGDLWLGRWARHVIHQLLFAVTQFSIFNPAWWSARISLFLIELGYFPWSRAQEFSADAFSARFAGPLVSAAAMRAVRTEAPALEMALALTLEATKTMGRGPARLTETVGAMKTRIPASQRHRIRLLSEGDPLELGGQTHPPIPARLVALARFPSVSPVQIPAFDVHRLNQLEERLTRMWLPHVKQFVSMEEFFSPPAIKAPVIEPLGLVFESNAVEPKASEFTANESDAPLELDFDRTWNKAKPTED